MHRPIPVIHLAVAVVAFLLAAVLTPAVRRLAHHAGVTDQPNGRKMHIEAVPRLGGVAVVGAAAIALALMPMVAKIAAAGTVFDAGDLRTWIALGAGGALVFGIGLLDDFHDLPASVKLGVEGVAALIVVWQGILVHTITVVGTTIELGWLAVPVTVIWLVGITNAFNLIDGLDGLAAGLAIIACATGAALFVLRGNPAGALPLVAMLGAAAGFLPYNFFPASIFLGDAGSLSLGFVLAVTSITGWQKGATAIAIGGPLLILALPILDTTLSVARRLPDRRRLFVADQEHLHHRLVASGLSPRATVLFLYVVALFGSALALATSQPQ